MALCGKGELFPIIFFPSIHKLTWDLLVGAGSQTGQESKGDDDNPHIAFGGDPLDTLRLKVEMMKPPQSQGEPKQRLV